MTLPNSGGTVSFKYDLFGRRIEKSSSSGTSIFAYDGDNLIEETNSSGGVVARYTQTQNIDDPLAMLRSSATSYYNSDGLGSITSLTNSAGAAAETYTYDSFGKVTASSGSLTNPFQYSGRESDSDTGLYYYRARYYDAGAGRFINEDPIEFAAGINFYRYVHNRPSTMIDPSGLVDVIHTEGIVVEANVDADCSGPGNPRGETAGGCNKVNYFADYKCTKQPCSDNWRGHVTVRLFGDVYVSSGPYPYHGQPAADKSVTDRASMIRHEQGHTSDKLNAILPIFNAFESMSFISEQECENAGMAAQIGAAARWDQATAESQRTRQ